MESFLKFFEINCPQCGHHWLPASLFWLVLGFAGQIVFTFRFILQWFMSEKLKKSVIPVGFWYLSIVGSLMALAYALYRRDPVFIFAYGFNSIIYVRNLILIAKHGGSISPFNPTSTSS